MKLIDIRDIPMNEFFRLDIKHFKDSAWFQTYLDGVWGGADCRAAVLSGLPKVDPIAMKQREGVTSFYLRFPEKKNGTNTFFITGKEILMIQTLEVGKIDPGAYLNNAYPNIEYSGWDPEIFVEDEKGIVPAFQFLPNKTAGIPTGRGRAYYDGFQAEFTTTPIHCHGRFEHLVSLNIPSYLLGLKQTTEISEV